MPDASHKRSRQALEDLLPSTTFEWLIDSAPDGFIIVDGSGRILFVNAQSERMFGRSEDELMGEPVEVLIPKALQGIHVGHRIEYMAAPRMRPMGLALELYGQRTDGTEFPVEISLSPLVTKRGLLVIAIIRDVTDYKRELLISQTLQNALLSPLPDELGGVKMASSYRSAYAGALVGGDFFDVVLLEPGLMALAIGDVSGKGLGAAVHTALAKYSFRAYLYEDPDPAAVMKRMNNTIYRQGEAEDFITFFYGLMDLDEGSLCCANAGHMPPLHLSCPSHEVSELVISGMPLGVSLNAAYEKRSVEFTSGQRMLFYSDGVTDARSANGLYGMGNLVAFFGRNGCLPPDQFVNQLSNILEEWSEGHLQDDVTMMLVAVD